MTKSERLLYLIHLMRGRKGVTLEEMASRCRVSARTLYRDLRTLSRQNYPVIFRNGYRLSGTASSLESGLSADDLQLLRLVLRTSSLASNPGLLRKLEIIDGHLGAAMLDRADDRIREYITCEGNVSPLSGKCPESTLGLFLRALLLNRRLAITVQGRRGMELVKPQAISIRGSVVTLVVDDPGGGGSREIDPATLKMIRLLRK